MKKEEREEEGGVGGCVWEGEIKKKKGEGGKKRKRGKGEKKKGGHTDFFLLVQQNGH